MSKTENQRAWVSVGIQTHRKIENRLEWVPTDTQTCRKCGNRGVRVSAGIQTHRKSETDVSGCLLAPKHVETHRIEWGGVGPTPRLPKCVENGWAGVEPTPFVLNPRRLSK
jgi:hypothetical protein